MAGNYSNNNSLNLLDGLDLLTTYGAFVESSDGALDLPKRKKGLEINWPDEHGLNLDTGGAYFESREISLGLVIATSGGYADFLTKVNSLKAKLSLSGFRCLKLANISKTFLVICQEGIRVRKVSKNNAAKFFGKVQVTLLEAYPINLQFKTDQGTLAQVSLNITTTKPCTIDWGDGSITAVASTSTKTHNYSLPGVYCIVVYGGVDGVSNITPTNATVLT